MRSRLARDSVGLPPRHRARSKEAVSHARRSCNERGGVRRRREGARYDLTELRNERAVGPTSGEDLQGMASFSGLRMSSRAAAAQFQHRAWNIAPILTGWRRSRRGRGWAGVYLLAVGLRADEDAAVDHRGVAEVGTVLARQLSPRQLALLIRGHKRTHWLACEHWRRCAAKDGRAIGAEEGDVMTRTKPGPFLLRTWSTIGATIFFGLPRIC